MKFPHDKLPKSKPSYDAKRTDATKVNVDIEENHVETSIIKDKNYQESSIPESTGW